ncbi:MAG TPA: DoxX family protein [Pilimelia sp.]|nr:DoxX family protein [Pilimelia sp.]
MPTTTTKTRSGPTALRRTRNVGLWVLQIALAAPFAAGGLLKVTGDAQMIELFADIGAGQWLRYLVGVLEIAGAVGLLIPRLVVPAALGLVALMVGATVTNVAILHTSPATPVTFLLAAGVVAAGRRQWLRGLTIRRPAPATPERG